MVTKSLQNKHAREFVKYSIVGGVGTVIDFGVLLLLVEIFGVAVLVANTISFVLAATNNYVLNNIWKFREKNKTLRTQYAKFLLVSIVALAINTVLMKVFVMLGMWYVSAKILIIGIVVFWNYLGNKLWTFRKTVKKPTSQDMK